MTRPRVLVITTGGTIAGRRQAGGHIAPGLAGSELLAAVPEVTRYADVTVRDLFNLPSAAMGWDEMLKLAAAVEQALQDPGLAGVVVTHGTGSMEDTAYFVDLFHADDRPVVFTGAMRNPTLPGADGPANLLHAVLTAADPRSRGHGVLVVMAGMIHAASSVMKVHAGSVAGFQSPESGPLGAIDEDYVYYARRLFRRPEPLPRPAAITARVERIPPGVGAGDRLLDAVLDLGVDGLVFEAGRFMPERLRRVERALAGGVTVVLCSPYLMGRPPRNTYRHQGGESHLLELGVIFSGTPARKARLKLAALLSLGLPAADMRDRFHAEWL